MSVTAKATNIWDTVKDDFQSLFPMDIYRTWFEPLKCLEESADKVILSVPNDFSAIWIQDNYMELIANRFQLASGRSVEVSLKVDGGQMRDEVEEIAKAPAAKPKRKKQEGHYLINPRNTFENFVVGPGNQLAHAASIAIANAPAKAYNPLFLYGETGLGKTHLMHAVAHHVLDNKHDMQVAYVSTEKFTNEFIRAIQNNTLTKFRQHYRSVDVLLIDDIHFLAGKERIQEEFFHTFNELFESQKQIFLSSDRPAGEISKLESRLISRFQWGLVTDIQPPDFETRVAILAKKAASMKLKLTDDVLQYLAEKVSKNIRRMEGALTRVAGYSALVKGTIDVESIEKLLHDVLQEEAKNQITVEKIQKKVAEYFQLRFSDMLSRRRPANIAFPRQIAMYLSRVLTSHSLQEIGESFGGRDHGTVIHACKSVESMMSQDASAKRTVEYLQTQLTKSC